MNKVLHLPLIFQALLLSVASFHPEVIILKYFQIKEYSKYYSI